MKLPNHQTTEQRNNETTKHTTKPPNCQLNHQTNKQRNNEIDYQTGKLPNNGTTKLSNYQTT